MKRFPVVIVAVFVFVQGGVAPAAMILQAHAPEKHDRFYLQHRPSDPEKAFIGEPYDWSGVARGTHWATMISPYFFLSAYHFHQDDGPLYFYNTNDPNGPVEMHDVESGRRIGQTDLWLGKLATPVSDDVATYPIASLASQSAYGGREIYTFGLSNTSPGRTNVRLGRNNINPGSFISYSDDHKSTGTAFLFTFDDPGLGADESYLQSGDSGGPSFVILDGSPAVVGIHWFIDGDDLPHYSGDTFVPEYAAQITAAMAPEPATLVMLLSLAAVGLVWLARRRPGRTVRS